MQERQMILALKQSNLGRAGRCGRAFFSAGAAILALAGCASLLPTSDALTQTPWGSFDEAMRIYNSIDPSKTTVADLKVMGLDPFAQHNISILSLR